MRMLAGQLLNTVKHARCTLHSQGSLTYSAGSYRRAWAPAADVLQSRCSLGGSGARAVRDGTRGWARKLGAHPSTTKKVNRHRSRFGVVSSARALCDTATAHVAHHATPLAQGLRAQPVAGDGGSGGHGGSGGFGGGGGGGEGFGAGRGGLGGGAGPGSTSAACPSEVVRPLRPNAAAPRTYAPLGELTPLEMAAVAPADASALERGAAMTAWTPTDAGVSVRAVAGTPAAPAICGLTAVRDAARADTTLDMSADLGSPVTARGGEERARGASGIRSSGSLARRCGIKERQP